MDALQEFEEPVFKYQQTGILKKNIAGILDTIVIFIIADLLATLVIPVGFLGPYLNSVKIALYYLIVFILYRLVSISFLSSTIGMRLLRCQYMHEGNLKLTVKEKVLAALMVYINGISMYNLK